MAIHRIVVEVEGVVPNRRAFNMVAEQVKEMLVNRAYNVTYLATEVVEPEDRNILVEKD